MGVYIGYLNYVVVLLLITGVLMLVIDAPKYKKDKLAKERKAAIILGVFNISTGVLIFVGNWVYNQWFFF